MAEATTTDTAHAKGGHHHSTKSYFVVWAILLTCTALTVWTGYMDLGRDQPAARDDASPR